MRSFLVHKPDEPTGERKKLLKKRQAVTAK